MDRAIGKPEIIAAIRRAAQELGRSPSRGELKRITGVSHYRVLTVFPTLRAAVRAAGLEPSRKGRPVSTEELIKDWQRVRRKLGRRPSRAEYVRDGKYSAGSLVGRFGAWSAVGKSVNRGGAEARRESGDRDIPPQSAQQRHGPGAPDIGSSGHLKIKTASREVTRTTRIPRNGPNAIESDKAIAFEWDKEGSLGPSLAVTAPLVQDDRWRRGEFTPRCFALRAAIPAPLEGKRRVTEWIAAMVVNTLMPGSTQHSALSIQPRNGLASGRDLEGRQYGRLRKDRPVMGPPFSRLPLTNAPVNEMGVVFLFALVAWDLGFQVESLWTRGEPDGRAKRQVAPGKWQEVWIEFEYESKNFRLHGHDPKKCDVLVCWRHNWKECPEEIEVIELSKIFGM
jgi:HNH endonuclease